MVQFHLHGNAMLIISLEKPNKHKLNKNLWLKPGSELDSRYREAGTPLQSSFNKNKQLKQKVENKGYYHHCKIEEHKWEKLLRVSIIPQIFGNIYILYIKMPN